MANTYDVDGIILNPINSMFGQGGQGRVEQVALTSDPKIGLVLKRLPITPEAKERTKALVDLCLPLLSPFLAAPIAVNLDGHDEIVHVAPLAIGNDLENDNRTVAESFEVGLHLACLTEILEEHGIAHGDLAPSNLIIETDGSVHLIDFDNFSSTDTAVPTPTMAGQPMMLAPEIRIDKQTPTIESDRFSFAVLLGMILLRRHPADGQAQVPADMDRVMTSGIWPERNRTPEPDDVPIAALGDKLCTLFDAAFLVDPAGRPTANEWRLALGEALHTLVIHDCGNAFVPSHTQTHCPWCQLSIEAALVVPHQLKITVPSTGARYSLALQDGKTIVLGRGNLGSHASVSGKHLELTPFGDKVFLRHIGRHPTAILKNGQWYNLKESWIDVSDFATAPIPLRLADLDIDIGV